METKYMKLDVEIHGYIIISRRTLEKKAKCNLKYLSLFLFVQNQKKWNMTMDLTFKTVFKNKSAPSMLTSFFEKLTFVPVVGFIYQFS